MRLLSKVNNLTRRILVINQFTIFLLIFLLILVIIAVVFVSQHYAQNYELPRPSLAKDYEVAKLRAEISQINSDTFGSLFWLKLIALFVTVGSAVGGYLFGQSKVNRSRIEAEDNRTKARLDFEKRKDVDSAYQAIVQELSGTQHVLRAAAAVKLGAILKSFPFEWTTSVQRKNELIDLTKQVLAAALSMEENTKVLKTISIAIVLHMPDQESGMANVQNIDLSEAKAIDAYWARVDFSYTDFYKAVLTKTSFRRSILNGAQFREAKLAEAVFSSTTCTGTNFKLADIRYADFSNAQLGKVNFEGAKMYKANFEGATITDITDTQVDNSPGGDGSEMVSIFELIEAQGKG